jgi:hypothetical protein
VKSEKLGDIIVPPRYEAAEKGQQPEATSET